MNNLLFRNVICEGYLKKKEKNMYIIQKRMKRLSMYQKYMRCRKNKEVYMEDKIEVEEYVRFNNGEIGKVIDIKENPSRIVYSKYGEIGLISDIVKHSKQLINLIEVGDIVNGYRVINVINEEPCPSGKCVDIDSSKDSSECTLWEEDIKTILTKEQYMANCYKVGGEDE